MSRSRSPRSGGRPWIAALAALALLALALSLAAESLSGLLTRRVVDTSKPLLAGAGALLLLIDGALRRWGYGDRFRRLRNGLLIGVAIASVLAW